MPCRYKKTKCRGWGHEVLCPKDWMGYSFSENSQLFTAMCELPYSEPYFGSDHRGLRPVSIICNRISTHILICRQPFGHISSLSLEFLVIISIVSCYFFHKGVFRPSFYGTLLGTVTNITISPTVAKGSHWRRSVLLAFPISPFHCPTRSAWPTKKSSVVVAGH